MTTHPALVAGNAAVITGGADGIGFAAARNFLSLGMRVCIADVDKAKLSEAKDALGDVLAVRADVSKHSELEALRDEALGAFGQVDVLMNNAGTGRGMGDLIENRPALSRWHPAYQAEFEAYMEQD